jgi:hypothetical protein
MRGKEGKGMDMGIAEFDLGIGAGEGMLKARDRRLADAGVGILPVRKTPDA